MGGYENSADGGRPETTALPETWAALFTRETAAWSAMVAGGVAVHALSVHVVATILPSAVAEVGGVERFAWTTTLALVGAILSSVCATTLASKVGYRCTYWAALTVFAMGSAVCAAAPTMAILLGGRLLQGVGGGLLTALAYASIRLTLPAGLRTRAIAMLSGVWGAAALSGPFLGGVLAGAGIWRWAFWMDLPLAAIIALLVHRVLPRRERPTCGETAPRIAILQLVLLGFSSLPVAWGGASATVRDAATGTCLGLALFWLMLHREAGATKAGAPHLLPTGTFNPRTAVGAVSLTMALMAASTTSVLYLPLVASRAYGFSPMAGGYFGGAMAISWTLTALATASVAEPRSRRRLVAGGPVLMFIGLSAECLALSTGSLPLMVSAMIPLGAGIGASWAQLGALLMETARPAERDLASALISTIQLIAGAIGSAVVGVVANLAGLAAAATEGDAVGIAQAAQWLFVVFSALPLVAIGTARRAGRNAWPV